MNEERVFRLRGDAWVLLWIFGTLTLVTAGLGVFLRPTKLDEQLVLVAMMLLFAIPCLTSWWCVVKTKVVIGDKSLIYSDWRGEARLHWKDISDYYFKRPNKFLIAHFEAKGRVFVLNHMLTANDELQQEIRQKAVASRAKEWQLLGTRTFDEWPRVFHYKDTNPIWIWLFAFGATFLLLALMVGEPLLRGGWNNIGNNFTIMFFGLSPLMILAFAFIVLFMCAAQPFIVVAMLLPRLNASRAFLKHTVSADLRRLVFQTPQEHTPITWDRVLDYYLDPVPGTLQSANRCVIVTARGEYSFLDTIVDSFTLREIVRTYATNALSKKWATRPGRDREQLKTPIHFQPKAGTKVFYFRTRTARAMMWLFTFYVVAIPIATTVRFYGVGASTGNTTDLVSAAVLTTVLAISMCIFWLSYFKTHLVLDERGIATHGLRRSRFIAWNSIESYTGGKNSPFFTLSSANGKIHVLKYLTDASDFKREVQNRAINSTNREWEQTQ